MPFADLSRALAASPARWSVRVEGPGGLRFDHDGDLVLPTASTGKLLLLLAVAHLHTTGRLDLAEPVRRDDVAAVRDSGLWQHLAAPALTVGDAATLVGAVSDNLATNVLLHRIGGTDAVAAVAASFGVAGIDLWDLVRDERTAAHPPTLSTASAAGAAAFWSRLHRADGIPAPTRDLVLGWLGTGVDLSMVAAAFGLDPLAHGTPDRGIALCNKTGTDAGIRADSGVVTGPAGTLSYACFASWTPDPADAVRDHVLARMRELGVAVRAAVGG